MIESVSPSGEYAFINIYNFPDTSGYYSSPTQIVLDIKKVKCWTLLDTTISSSARYFAWSEDSKRALFSATNRQAVDVSGLSPIYLYDLQSRSILNLKKPWLYAVHHSIPLFFPKRSKIIFWSPTVVLDTSYEYVSYIPPIGKIFIWDTLQKSIIEIKKGDEIYKVYWMQLYDTTSLYIDVNHALWSLCLSTGDMEKVLPDIRVVSEIRRFQNEIVFSGRSDRGNRIYVYDLEKKLPEITLDYPKGPVLNASINSTNKLAVETVKNNHYWIFIVSKKGVVLDSLKGNSPFWLAGTDSLIYSEGKKIGLAYWQNKQIKREIVLEIVK